tara:strand:+ start:249 stop:506 length:258 start_codon:yes stop_codon:yes gene_type:complete
MNSYILYLNTESKQDVIDMRWKHIIKTINHDEHEVRVYTKGQDFHKEERELPYATINGKPKSFENFYDEVIGEKKLDEEENNDDN